MIHNPTRLLHRIRAIHEIIRDTVVAACEQNALEQLSAVVAEEAGDTIFAIDRISEETLLHHFEDLAREWPCVLIAEGLGETGILTLPSGLAPEAAAVRIIVDPIDGTRGLMYQKRPAWILTGVASSLGPQTALADIEIAIQTEIPLVKQHLSDTFWAIAGNGVQGERFNRITGERQPLRPQPSRANTIKQGCGGLARFFPGARGALAAVDDAVIERILGPIQPGKALAFEDQYICTGGQFYELIMGHDRWTADVRPLVETLLQQRGLSLGLCCHPYDLCTELIARESGIHITGEYGQPLNAPLDISADVSWVGYANTAIRNQVEPVLQEVLREHGLLAAQGGEHVAL